MVSTSNTARLPAPPLARDATTASRWLSWIVGGALLGAVIIAARHFAEERALVAIIERAQPWWLVVAIACQLLTYAAQGQVWRIGARAAGAPMSVGAAYKLSLAELFVDQALPSGGVAGSVLIAHGLERRGMPMRAVMACVVLDGLAHYAAYVACLAIAVGLVLAGRVESAALAIPAVAFMIIAATLAGAVLTFAGRPPPAFAVRLARFKIVERFLTLVENVDGRLVRSPPLLLRAGSFHVIVVLLDTATMWFLLLALGTQASPAAVFTSFMASSLFRSIGIVPGGLGTFEAASVLTLKLAGIPVAVALAATLAFRGLSFWLPMLPGLYFSRAIERRTRASRKEPPARWWSTPSDELVRQLDGTQQGLSSREAERRLTTHGANEITEHAKLSHLRTLWNQLKSPLVLLLVFACAASAATSEWVDASIVLAILVASTLIGYSREYRAQAAAHALLARVQPHCSVVRDGREIVVPTRDVVPGDVTVLSAGSLVPADALILSATDFFVNEAVLTGESFPVEKKPGVASASAGLAQRGNCVFFGTNVRSGAARCLVVATGAATEFGAIAHRLTLRPPETEFDRGIRRFGALLMRAMVVMIVVVVAVNVLLDRSVTETLLFAIALAVGLSPELLPAILNVNLARGAQMMAKHGVLVRRLPGIENLGSMDILCTDKTGTLTEGVIRLDGAYDDKGERSGRVLALAGINAALQSGLANPLDVAITQAAPRVDGVTKIADIPYDFVRKRLSVVVRTREGIVLITKGAVASVLERCRLDDDTRAALLDRFRSWAAQGTRVLAVATRAFTEEKSAYGRDDEDDLHFEGFLTFLDTPKQGVESAIRDLAALGVSIKLITGDAELVARHVAKAVGLRADRVLTGRDLDELHDEALWYAAERTDLFVEVDPNQKERIILALKKQSHVVGFLGDGVNDAPAMHAADTSVSVEDAVDVARQAADFVLLERDLDVIRAGIQEGRKTFANTLKYVLTTTSANLGNMISMAVASLFLPFLPLTAGQILLNNFLSDVPAIGIASDNVDKELVDRPRRWDMRFIRRFMLQFGVLSSLFDVVTFGVLLFVFRAGADLFRTGWFVESLLTELVIALVVRTQRPFFKSRPGRFLLYSSIALIVVTFAIPFLPHVEWLGFVPLPPLAAVAIAAVAALYVLATEALKHRFYRSDRAAHTT